MFVSKCQQVTLSEILNAVDGLRSCCGEEHIIVFTTNHKEWTSKFICHIATFQLLSNWLLTTCALLFEKIEVLLGEVQVTPAEIAEELTKDVDATECLQDLIKFLQVKKISKKVNN